MHGGVAQGIGQALVEQSVYDRAIGPDAVRRASWTTPCRAPSTARISHPSWWRSRRRTNPLGVKGIGESGTIGAPPTIINAVLDALRPMNVGHLDMPLTPHRVWQAIQTATAKA